ncbi:MAG TPA: tRNA (adenosine(37)-N6)-dimethylallyltransferase MiaA [Blastocatellia bacterium]|nr:tRNA (adenosine(37)-N6)-dimethylallyltransferase MiaA [Blastocatellia bacterium]
MELGSKKHGRSIPAIVGPTASGKSDLGIALALATDGEVINLDSVQVYRGLYSATSKVPASGQQGIPHHLIDIAEPAENFTAGEYARRASATIRDVESRGRRSVLVGGTGFYLRALVHPLFESPETDIELRGRLKQLVEENGPEYLHRMLERLDEKAAARISPRDWSRTMRALEFRFQTGLKISESQPDSPSPAEFTHRIVVIALAPPRGELYAVINARAERMFASGLVEEVRTLVDSGVPLDAKAFQAHGYRRVVEYFQGLLTLEQALEQMKLDTRHYAKRQLSWWRRWPGVKWINRFGNETEAVGEALQLIEEYEQARD